MIAYVRDGFRIHPHLAASLSDATRHESLGSPTSPKPVSLSSRGEESLHLSVHQRLFIWKQNGLRPLPSRFTIRGTIARSPDIGTQVILLISSTNSGS